MELNRLEKFMVDDTGSIVQLERICKMVSADFYLKKRDDEFLILRKQGNGNERIGRIIVRNGSLITKTEKILAGFYRHAVEKKRHELPSVKVGHPLPDHDDHGSAEATTTNMVNTQTEEIKVNTNKEREIVYVEPVFTKKLHQALGGNGHDVARCIGVDGGIINKALRENQIRMPNELACQAVYQRDFAQINKQPTDRKFIGILTMPTEHVDILNTFITTLGGGLKKLDI